jgi:hypothetical protein
MLRRFNAVYSVLSLLALVGPSCGGRVETEQSSGTVSTGSDRGSSENSGAAQGPTVGYSAPAINSSVAEDDDNPSPLAMDGGAAQVMDATPPKASAEASINPAIHDAAQDQVSVEARPPGNRCTDLVADGPAIISVDKPAPEPNVGLGGPIFDGVYDLSEFTYYVGPDVGFRFGTSDRETIRISGAGTLLEYISDGVPSGMVISLAPRGGSLNYKPICPAEDFNMFVGPFYTATLNRFAAQSGSYEKVFIKRP